jgi:glucose/arabinose dehydrogenase
MDTVISNLPGSNDHNSGRMTISPQTETDGTYKLYYTIGDMGAGQFNNSSRTMHAQNRDTCEGKILRLNTEPDADGIPGSPIHDFDKWRHWIPNDNPYTHSAIGSGTMETPVYSYGHRNAQGIIWGNANGTWRLYSSEHGDKSDDEVNEITAGSNYGWPKVAGLGDDNYSSLDAYPNNDQLASQNINYSENTWAVTNSMQRPLFATFNWGASAIPSSGSNIFTWGTIAPSSIDFYKGNIPGWQNSLLVTSLKYGMYRLKLKTDGTYVDSTASSNTVDTFPLLHGWRVRDVAIDPAANSGTFWVVIDSTGSTSGPTGGFNGSSSATKDGGKVLKLSYKTLLTLPLTANPPARPPVVKDLVQIFPNPVQSVLYIHGKKELRKPLLVQVCDIYGRLLKEETSFRNDFSVDVSFLIPGTYLLKLFNGYGMEVQVEKFIKE